MHFLLVCLSNTNFRELQYSVLQNPWAFRLFPCLTHLNVSLPFLPSLSYPFLCISGVAGVTRWLLEFLAFAAALSPAGLGFPHVPTPWQSIWLAEFPLGLALHTQPALALISLDEEKRGGGWWEVSDIGPRVFIRWPLPSHMPRAPPLLGQPLLIPGLSYSATESRWWPQARVCPGWMKSLRSFDTFSNAKKKVSR